MIKKHFTLWIGENNRLPELQYISLKSMLLTGHEVTLYSYSEFDNVPKGVKLSNANKILDESNIFVYKEGFKKVLIRDLPIGLGLNAYLKKD